MWKPFPLSNAKSIWRICLVYLIPELDYFIHDEIYTGSKHLGECGKCLVDDHTLAVQYYLINSSICLGHNK